VGETTLLQRCYDVSEGQTREREIQALVEAADETGIENCLLLTMDTRETFATEGVEITLLPAWQWCLGENG